MGQGLSCKLTNEHGLFISIQNGESEIVEALVNEDPAILGLTTVHGKLSALHVAAANGHLEVLSMLLDRSVQPDILNRRKQTPLMLAAMHGKHSCVVRLIEAGANILMFDSVNGRTCLHHAANYGHVDCLQTIISAANSFTVAQSWGFERFLNIRDGNGATPLHLAARQRNVECVRMLLGKGALVNASTGGYSFPGSAPLHLAAQAGSLECIRELLAWGADRLQRDSSGRMPFQVALKHKYDSCASLLNPSAPEPLTWPAPLKFISELNAEAKALLEKALIEANKEREKLILKETSMMNLPISESVALNVDPEVNDVDLCCICFERACTIEIQECGHQMCAHCILVLCCYKKHNPSTNGAVSPICPFCRRSITRLNVARKTGSSSDVELECGPSQPRRSRKPVNLHEGSSSFKSLSSSLGSFGKIAGRSVAADGDEGFHKL